MKRSSRCFALGLFTVMLAACGGEDPPEDTGPTSRTLWLVEHATTDAVVDTGAMGDSAGDLITFANEVFDESNSKKLGTDQGYCVRTVAGKSWECGWTVFLAEGQISVQGPFDDTQDSILAITGGTGAFNDARGQMKLHARNPSATEYDFVYEILEDL